MTDEQKATLEANGYTIAKAASGEDWESYFVSKDGFGTYVRGDDDETAQAIIDSASSTE